MAAARKKGKWMGLQMIEPMRVRSEGMPVRRIGTATKLFLNESERTKKPVTACRSDNARGSAIQGCSA
jgi:hypothetical protein